MNKPRRWHRTRWAMLEAEREYKLSRHVSVVQRWAMRLRRWWRSPL